MKRNIEGTHDGSTAVLNSNSTVAVASKIDPAHKSAYIPQAQQKNQQQISPPVGQQSSNEVKNVNNIHHTGVHEEACKPAAEREKVVQFPADKKDLQSNKLSSGFGGSLATMWGRASAKSKPVEAPAETSNSKSNTAGEVSYTLYYYRENKLFNWLPYIFMLQLLFCSMSKICI